MLEVDSFPAALAKIDHAVSNGEFNDLSEICELAELLAAEQEQDPQKVDMMYCVHALAYFLHNDLVKMKYLFRRIPPYVLERDGTLKILHGAYIARCTIDLPLFFKQLEQLKDIAGPLIPLANEVISRQRDLILDNIGMMYSKVSIEKAQKMLDVDSAQVLTLARAREWEHDERFLIPPREAAKDNPCEHEASLNDQLRRITELVAFLERHHVTKDKIN